MEAPTTENGAILWEIETDGGEKRYQIEGETGERLAIMECTEAEAQTEFKK